MFSTEWLCRINVEGADIVSRQIKLQNMSLLSQVDDRLRHANARALDAEGGSVLMCDNEPENIVCSETSGALKILDRWAMEGRIHVCAVLLIAAQKRREKKRLSRPKVMAIM